MNRDVLSNSLSNKNRTRILSTTFRKINQVLDEALQNSNISGDSDPLRISLNYLYSSVRVIYASVELCGQQLSTCVAFISSSLSRLKISVINRFLFLLFDRNNVNIPPEAFLHFLLTMIIKFLRLPIPEEKIFIHSVPSQLNEKCCETFVAAIFKFY